LATTGAELKRYFSLSRHIPEGFYDYFGHGVFVGRPGGYRAICHDQSANARLAPPEASLGLAPCEYGEI
jgi:hypothetical protein